jgi:hypothetical protein
MAKMTTFKIKTVFLKVAKHFLNPHAALVGAQSVPGREQVGGQELRLFFTGFPPGHQMHTIAMFARQLRAGKPARSCPWLRQAVKAPPRVLIRQLDPGIALLARSQAPLGPEPLHAQGGCGIGIRDRDGWLSGFG